MGESKVVVGKGEGPVTVLVGVQAQAPLPEGHVASTSANFRSPALHWHASSASGEQGGGFLNMHAYALQLFCATALLHC